MQSHPATIANMSFDELEALIHLIMRRETAQQTLGANEERQSLDELFASIDRDPIILSAEAKSPLQLLREDRER